MVQKKRIAVIVGAGIVDVAAGPVDTSVFEQSSFPAERVTLGFGGDALNEATVLARLGAPVRLVSKVGQDAAGGMVVEHCANAGIDTRFIRREPGIDTGINIVLVDGAGERRFIASESGSLRKLSPADIEPAALDGARLLCLASVFVSPLLPPADMAALFAECRRRGIPTCADFTRPKNGEGLADVAEMLSQLDYIFPNLDEAAALTGRATPEAMAEALLGCGVGNVAIKMGAQGCYIANAAWQKQFPAVAGIRSVDTTGAGDSFTAGFLYGLLEGWQLEECALFAGAAASLTVETFGANEGAGSLARVQQRLAEYKAQLS